VTILLTAVLLSLLGVTQAAPEPACLISDDATYGRSPENPVQIGGGALYVKAREERYLAALRGPSGEPLTLRRLGQARSQRHPDTILDAFEVTYEGLETPITLYLDAYHYWEHRAPQGLTCARPFNLPPIPDAFQASNSLLAVALEQGGSRAFDPIPLDASGSAAHGVMWDGFRMLAIAARAAAAAGKPLTPAARPAGGTVAVAYPLQCDGRTVAPVAIDFVDPQGTSMKRDAINDAAIAVALPGVDLPAGSVAARFPVQQIRPTDRVRITYAEPACPENVTAVILPVTFTESRGVETPEVPLPEGANPEQKRVLLQALIDLDGRFQRGTYAGGPAHLADAAIEAIRTWRAEPARVNGAPVPWATLLEVRFE
jgi:hypothetical protein